MPITGSPNFIDDRADDGARTKRRTATSHRHGVRRPPARATGCRYRSATCVQRPRRHSLWLVGGNSVRPFWQVMKNEVSSRVRNRPTIRNVRASAGAAGRLTSPAGGGVLLIWTIAPPIAAPVAPSTVQAQDKPGGGDSARLLTRGGLRQDRSRGEGRPSECSRPALDLRHSRAS